MNASGWSASCGVLCVMGVIGFLFAFNPWGAVICALVAIVFFWLAHEIAVEASYYSDDAELKRFFNR